MKKQDDTAALLWFLIGLPACAAYILYKLIQIVVSGELARILL